MLQISDAHYRIVKVLNAGKEGESYLAFDTKNSESLKHLLRLSKLKASPRSLLKGEAKMLEKVSQEDSQLQKIFGYFEENQEFFIVQEFIPGNSLINEIYPGRTLGSRQVINLLIEILSILVFLHSRGIIHRNIKPENIIRRNSDNKLVLIDFGAVKEVVNNDFIFSEYMPEEELVGNTQFNSDIYSLGIIAIAALTGLSAKEIYTLTSSHKAFTGKIIWRQKAVRVNRSLANIIDKMVTFDYRWRYQSATKVLDDLKKLAPTGFFQNPRSWQIFTGIAALIVVSLGGCFFPGRQTLSDVKELYKQGEQDYQIGNYKKAINDFTQVLEINPKFTLAYNRRGDAFYQLGDYQKATVDSSSAIELNPKDATAYYNRGFAFYKLGNYQKAIADYDQAISLNPGNADFHYGRGLARAKLKDSNGAMADFNQAITIEPHNTQAYFERGILRRRVDLKLEAIQDFDKVIAANPSNVEAYYESAATHYSLNENRSAIRDYTKVIKFSPKNFKAYIGRGDAYNNLGYKLKAYTDYNQAILLNPKSASAYTHLGFFLYQQGNYQTALTDLNQAIGLDTHQAKTYNARGCVSLAMGNNKAAVEDFSQAIALKPDYATAYYNRGLINTSVADLQTAAKLFEQKGDNPSYNEAQLQIQALQEKSQPQVAAKPDV